ncbi:MAG: hypothetical protein ACYS30_21290 [Planctomycetota bacterium]
MGPISILRRLGRTEGSVDFFFTKPISCPKFPSILASGCYCSLKVAVSHYTRLISREQTQPAFLFIQRISRGSAHEITQAVSIIRSVSHGLNVDAYFHKIFKKVKILTKSAILGQKAGKSVDWSRSEFSAASVAGSYGVKREAYLVSRTGLSELGHSLWWGEPPPYESAKSVKSVAQRFTIDYRSAFSVLSVANQEFT